MRSHARQPCLRGHSLKGGGGGKRRRRRKNPPTHSAQPIFSTLAPPPPSLNGQHTSSSLLQTGAPTYDHLPTYSVPHCPLILCEKKKHGPCVYLVLMRLTWPRSPLRSQPRNTHTPPPARPLPRPCPPRVTGGGQNFPAARKKRGRESTKKGNKTTTTNHMPPPPPPLLSPLPPSRAPPPPELPIAD